MPTITQSTSEAFENNLFNKLFHSLCVSLAIAHQRIGSQNLHNTCLFYNLLKIMGWSFVLLASYLVLASEDVAGGHGWWENWENPWKHADDSPLLHLLLKNIKRGGGEWKKSREAQGCVAIHWKLFVCFQSNSPLSSPADTKCLWVHYSHIGKMWHITVQRIHG